MPTISPSRGLRLRSVAVLGAVLAVLIAVPSAAPAQTPDADQLRAAARGAQAAGFHYLSAGPKMITRNGKDYLVSLTAFEGFGDGISITITQRRDPSGRRVSERMANWSFSVEDVLFPNQSPPKVTTGANASAIRPFGAVKMRLDQDSSTKSCGGKDIVRKGSLDGTLRLVDPRLPFANDTLEFNGLPNAVLSSTSGDCFTPPPNRCPTPTQSLSVSKGSENQKNIYVSHTNGVNAVSTFISSPAVDLKRNTTTIGSFRRSASQTMPVSADGQTNFSFTPKLGEMNVYGGAFGFIHGPSGSRGKTEFAATKPLSHFESACGTAGKEAVYYDRYGNAHSNFRVDLLFGPTMNFSDIGMLEGNASRNFLR